MLTSELTVHMLKMYCKEGTSVVLPSTTEFLPSFLPSFIHSFIHSFRMELWVGQCNGETLGDAYIGWKSVSGKKYLGPSPNKGVSNTLWRCFTHSLSQSFNPFSQRPRSSGNENVFHFSQGRRPCTNIENVTCVKHTV